LEDKSIQTTNELISFIEHLNTDSDIKYFMLLDNIYELKITYQKDKSITILGYIKNDAVNSYIRTSQISNKYLYEQKHLINKTKKIIL
jgi:vacuolar-type H+-ATPase subunit I/STV1